MFLGITLFALAGLTIPFTISQADAQPITEIPTCIPGEPEVMCKPNCDCYYANDAEKCEESYGDGATCGGYMECKEGTPVDGKRIDGTCRANDSDKSRDSQELESIANAMDAYLIAYESAGSSGGGKPDLDQEFLAESLNLTPDEIFEINRLANDIVMLVTGPVYSEDGLPHHQGHYFGLTLDSDDRMSRVAAMEESTLTALSHVRKGVIAEILNPKMNLFNQHMLSLNEKVPSYDAFGRCEYPHEHDHAFPYNDGIDCLTFEIQGILNWYNRVDPQHIAEQPSVMSISSDGSVIVSIWASKPTVDEVMNISIQFKDLRGNLLENVNYDILLTQENTVIYDEKGIYNSEGIDSHATLPLNSADPVDIEIILQGFGISETNRSGLIGERLISTSVIPEFGPITLTILGIAIMTTIIVGIKTKLVPKI